MSNPKPADDSAMHAVRGVARFGEISLVTGLSPSATSQASGAHAR